MWAPIFFARFRFFRSPCGKRIAITELPPSGDLRVSLQNRLGACNESIIIKGLPPRLSMDLSLFLKRELIDNVPLFKGAGDAFIREVALELHAVVCPPGEYVIRSGDVGRDM